MADGYRYPLTAVKRADTDLSFRLEFPKAREPTPENRADFAAISVALVDDAWTCDAPSASDAHVTGAAKIALKLLHRCLADTGERAPASNHIPPGARTTTLVRWRSYCDAGTVASTDKPDAKRKAFVRAVQKLQDVGVIGVWTDYGGSSDMPDIDGHAALSARRQPGRQDNPL